MKQYRKQCKQCNVEFFANAPAGQYCSQSCGQKWRYANSSRSTEYQYSKASRDWRKYYQRRVSEKGRSATLSVKHLLDLHDMQKGKCALTGINLTCKLEKGVRCLTNASLDRIDPKGEYILENLQLVCVAVNRLRSDMSVNEFHDWCKKVVNYRKRINQK